MEILAENKRVFYDYEILQRFEGGLVLKGNEVKAIKNKKMNLTGSYVILRNNDVYLLNSEVSPYQPKNISLNYQPKRSRKILLKKNEINSLSSKIKQKGAGLTLIPLKVYNKNGLIKLEFALAKGKHRFDKREKIKKREALKRIERAKKNLGDVGLR
ncbi:MAG TPA: SsrA-binding protein SmpB [Candidatus Paceibacterota bacterium]|nr:SsrA-binding protein SmpB [Candidatus Paceibacterota bacterium]